VLRQCLWVIFLVLPLGVARAQSEPEQPPRYTITTIIPDYKLLPEGAALCLALGIKVGDPCDDNVILEQSQYSTDKDLWIGKTQSGLAAESPYACIRPIAIMTYGEGGIIHACHEPEADDTVIPLDLQRLQNVAGRLNNQPNKTLAEHRWIMGFKDLWRRVNR